MGVGVPLRGTAALLVGVVVGILFDRTGPRRAVLITCAPPNAVAGDNTVPRSTPFPCTRIPRVCGPSSSICCFHFASVIVPRFFPQIWHPRVLGCFLDGARSWTWVRSQDAPVPMRYTFVCS